MPRNFSSNRPLRRTDHEEKPEVKAGYIRMPAALIGQLPEASEFHARKPILLVLMAFASAVGSLCEFA